MTLSGSSASRKPGRLNVHDPREPCAAASGLVPPHHEIRVELAFWRGVAQRLTVQGFHAAAGLLDYCLRGLAVFGEGQSAR